VISSEIFARHLDLTPLRGRARGLVKCPFHDDGRASLSVDLAAGVFHCFGCGAEGGWRRFAELTGDATAPRRAGRGSRESDLQQARRAVMAREERAAAERREWAPWHHVNAHVGRCLRAAERARAAATCLGPDDPRTWPLLEHAAHVERHGRNLEGALDALLLDGPLA
jgi:hypothetical protein